MNAFWQNFPKGEGLLVYAISLAVGGFVLYKYCLDQFGKRSVVGSENESWKFILVQYQTSPRQYLNGFSTYFSAMMLIFLLASVVGPGPIATVAKAITAALGGTMSAPDSATTILLSDYPAFPILVAFYMVGLNPNLPRFINFEESIRGLAHRVAYIPSNMDRLLNYMTFANISMPEDKIERAWHATELQRPSLSAPDLKELAPTINRLALLYASAATMADDARFADIRNIAAAWRTDVFRQYRAEIQNVSVAMQAIDARLSDLPDAATAAGDRRRAIATIQRELIRNLDLLYAIIGAAINAQDSGRTTDRLLAFGFDSPYPPNEGIPWNPVLKVTGAAAIVLIASGLIASKTFIGSGSDPDDLIPDTTGGMLQLIGIYLVVHLVSIVRALSMRTRLIRKDRYFEDNGQYSAVSYIKIFVNCYVICLIINLMCYGPNLVVAITQENLAWAQITSLFLKPQMYWSAVPAFCGAMTAFTLDRPSASYSERLTSALIEGGGMATAALLIVEQTIEEPAFEYRCFVGILFGGLGFVLGFMLPAAIRRHREAQLSRLPEQISVLRNCVLHYFRDFQQFGEWLNAGDPDLDGKRPRDVLMEQNGLQRLISLVNTNRPPLGASGA